MLLKIYVYYQLSNFIKTQQRYFDFEIHDIADIGVLMV